MPADPESESFAVPPAAALAVIAARRGLHTIAERLLAGPQWRTSGTIRLTVTSDGFGTIRPPAAEIGSLTVRPGSLLRQPDGLAVPLTGSVDSLAAALGVQPGPPDGVYPAASPADSQAALELPPTGVDVVLTALISGGQALRAFTATAAADQALEPVLWPEHFDLGLSLDEVNYGISPGDDEHDLPYVYVGPWAQRQGAFWNEPFGASQTLADLADVTAITAFLLEGRARAAADPPA